MKKLHKKQKVAILSIVACVLLPVGAYVCTGIYNTYRIYKAISVPQMNEPASDDSMYAKPPETETPEESTPFDVIHNGAADIAARLASGDFASAGTQYVQFAAPLSELDYASFLDYLFAEIQRSTCNDDALYATVCAGLMQADWLDLHDAEKEDSLYLFLYFCNAGLEGNSETCDALYKKIKAAIPHSMLKSEFGGARFLYYTATLVGEDESVKNAERANRLFLEAFGDKRPFRAFEFKQFYTYSDNEEKRACVYQSLLALEQQTSPFAFSKKRAINALLAEIQAQNAAEAVTRTQA